MLSFGLGFAAKDLKDIDGDEATGVWTLPVLLGPAAGRVAVAVLVLLGYLSVAALLPYAGIRVAAALLGLGSAATVLVWKRRELADVLLAVCLLFTAAVAFVALSNAGPLLERMASSGSVLEARTAEFRASTAEAWSDWASASAGFTEAALVFTDDPDVQLRAGATLFEQERYREALPYLARAADLDRSSPIALEYLVRAEFESNRAESAEWLLFEAIRNGIRPGVFYAVAGEQRMAEGKPGAAAALFDRALKLGRPELPTRIRVADGLLAANQPIRARTQDRIAVEHHPASAEARDALGRCLAATGEPEQATWELEEAVRLEPDNALYWNNLGAALRMAGRHEESLPAIDEAVRLDPTAPEPYYNRGLTLDALGRTSEARRQYLLALELDPGHGPARSALDRASP